MTALSGKIILLTGGTGFIGSHLAARLRQISDVKLVLLSRRTMHGTSENFIPVNSSLKELTRDTWLNHNIEKIDIVFHLGAFTPKRGSEGDCIEPIYNDNLIGTRALLESLPGVPERIVFASTLDVYAPPPENAVLTEQSPLQPSSLYGASKLFCENLVRTYARQHGCGYAILRYGHIYGPGEGAYAKVIPLAIKSLLRNESPVLFGDGSVKRDFLFVTDAVEATVRAALTNNRALDPVNIVRGESRTIREYVETLCRLIGFSGEITYQADKPAGRSVKFNNDKMAETLGCWKTVELEEGLRQEIEYFRNARD